MEAARSGRTRCKRHNWLRRWASPFRWDAASSVVRDAARHTLRCIGSAASGPRLVVQSRQSAGRQRESIFAGSNHSSAGEIENSSGSDTKRRNPPASPGRGSREPVGLAADKASRRRSANILVKPKRPGPQRCSQLRRLCRPYRFVDCRGQLAQPTGSQQAHPIATQQPPFEVFNLLPVGRCGGIVSLGEPAAQ